MKTYSQFRPTGHDEKGLGLPDHQDWYVLACGHNRDSGPLDESNFATALETLGGEGDDVQIHRFGHWGPGWFEIILVRPSTEACSAAEEIERRLRDYPILDEEDFSKREDEAAQLTWRECLTTQERVTYVRDHRNQFEFHSFSDMLSCVRGNYFGGYASELLS